MPAFKGAHFETADVTPPLKIKCLAADRQISHVLHAAIKTIWRSVIINTFKSWPEPLVYMVPSSLQDNAYYSCKEQLVMKWSGSLSITALWRKSNNSADVNTKVTPQKFGISGATRPARLYFTHSEISIRIGSILFSQLIQSSVYIPLKNTSAENIVNFIETFCVIMKIFCNTVDVAQKWKNVR